MNHFIELGKSTDESIWLTIHTGSRQLGEKICKYWQNATARRHQSDKEDRFRKGLEEIKFNYKGPEISKRIQRLKSDLGMNNKVEKVLDYVEGEDLYGYLTDMIFAQHYARKNRIEIMGSILKTLGLAVGHQDSPQAIESIHNYIDFDDFIIRKGAISAHKNKLMIIPFNMEDGILICRGKGNSEWNYSAPHGAGRIKSRSQAKRDLSAEVARKRMEEKGIFTSTVPVDEVKEAYKDPKVIEEAISPTAKVIDRIKPFMNLKAGE